MITKIAKYLVFTGIICCFGSGLTAYILSKWYSMLIIGPIISKVLIASVSIGILGLVLLLIFDTSFKQSVNKE